MTSVSQLFPADTNGAAEPGLSEQGLTRTPLLDGHFLRVVKDTALLPDGSTGEREFIIHPGAVMIVAISDAGELVLERQFRYPMGRAIVEFPAGKLDAGESSLSCAQRELREETGYTAREWAFAGVLHPVVSYSTEHIDVWFARGLQLGPRQLDQGEFLDVFTCTVAALQDAVRDGLVTDAKTLVGLLWLQNHSAGRWPLQWLAADSPSQPTPAGPWAPADPRGGREGA